MKLPIRVTIATVFALFTAVSISTVTGVNFFGGRAIVLDTAKEEIAKSATSAQESIDALVGRAFMSAETVAAMPQQMFYWQAPDALLSALTVGLRNNRELYGIFIGFPDGAFVQAINLRGSDGVRRKVAGMPDAAAMAWRVMDPMPENAPRPAHWRYFDDSGDEIRGAGSAHTEPSSYDPRKRPWFLKAQAEKKATVSDVYVFQSLNKPGLTVSQPLRGMPSAVVGVDLSLSDLARLAKRLRPGANGVFAVTDDKSRVIAFSGDTTILKKDVADKGVELKLLGELSDSRLARTAMAANAKERAESSFALDDKVHLGFQRPASKSGRVAWNVVSIAAIEDFTGQLMASLYRSLTLAGVIVALSVLLMAVMSAWISGPVIRLKRIADQITTLNLSKAAPFNTPFEEIGRLQDSMERMRAALDIFLRFVPRDVVRELFQTDEAVGVGGVRREVTLLFTDVEGFTTMTERMTPEEIMSQASEYFETLSFGIQANRGTIDKFIGDAIMAIWNAPTDDPLHVDNACRGTLTAHRISEDLNGEFAAAGKPIMRTRFGLHTAEVLVGNVGARDRMQYTCLGSGVNLAARLEGLNKFYGTQILASGAVRQKASADYLFRRVDIVQAKGTSIPVTVFELLGERGEDAAFYVGADTMRRAGKYEQAFDFYLHRDFADALTILDELRAEQPDDPVVALLTGKCRRYLSEPPSPDWNGATNLDEK